jgi:hypothetical protein
VLPASSDTPAAGGPNEKSVPYSYDETALTLGSTTIVNKTTGTFATITSLAFDAAGNAYSETVHIKFGLCGTFIHDDSVIINVMDVTHPDSAITTYVEGGDIVIDHVAGD